MYPELELKRLITWECQLSESHNGLALFKQRNKKEITQQDKQKKNFFFKFIYLGGRKEGWERWERKGEGDRERHFLIH